MSGPAHLLIVDDNRDAADTLCAILEIAGHQVWVVRSGATALNHAALSVVDLVVIDLGMPMMNGFELARLIKRKIKHNCLLIAVTGWERPGDLMAARDAGFDHYFVKPIDPDALEAYINTVVAEHPRLRELKAKSNARKASSSDLDGP